VSNPPFVPGPARVDYVYRDSGQAGDDALAALVAALPDHLAPGGVAQLLGSWLHVRGQDWPDRVRSWLPDGVDAWIVQREVTDPALHVGTWQRDAGLDVTAPTVRARAGAWLDWMAAQQVEAVGFGFLTLRRVEGAGTDRTPTVVVEDLPGDLDDPLGPEVAGWLDRVDWLRDHPADALLDARLRLADGVVLERYATAGDDGWTEVGAAVARAEGPRWRHEVDEPAAALLAGCRGALPLGELVALLALAHDRPTDALVAATLPAVRELVRHGLLVPAP
jgi:methylase of polypeptide subunit release factors